MSMQPFTIVSGKAVPLLVANVDTDVIIRIERLTTLGKHELGPHAFEALRMQPDCVFDQQRWKGAPILLAATNFGCGSSREGAVWALQGLGIRAVIAPSFGDIFFSNCFQNGVLPIRLPLADIEALAVQCADGAPLTVDLTNSTLTAPDGTQRGFEVDAMKRESLLHGLDDIGLTLKDDDAIRAWQARDRGVRPWAWPVASD